MKVYIDLVYLLNFFIDFLVLLTTSIILKRNIKIIKIIEGAFIGSLTVLLLFINLNAIELFIVKLIISILMIIVTFKYKNIKYFLINYLYLYMVSIFLGGSLYLINNSFKYNNVGLLFINNGFSINSIILIILVPVALFIFIKQNKRIKKYNDYYNTMISYSNKVIHGIGYMDSGNTLVDYLTNKPVIFIKGREPTTKYRLLSINTVSGNNMIKIYKGNIDIPDLNIKKDILVSFIDNINIDNVDFILNREII